LARLYANENFPLPVVEELRRLGHDVLTLQETGRGGQAMPDDEVLAFAHDVDRILLTFNRKHFIRLHSANQVHAGIIVCTFDRDFKTLALRIHDQLQALQQADAKIPGQLLRINRP
jgi:predicted nuclease of predicted toxin-antitoxin system